MPEYSLLAHIDDLKFFMVNCKIDVLCINETKLNSSVSNSEIYLSGYDVVRLDRNVNGRNGGGICVYIYEVIVISVFVKIWQIKILNFY